MSRTDEPERVRDVFLAALDLPEPDRPAYVAAAAGSPSVRDEVLSLLGDHADVQGTGFLSSPVVRRPTFPIGLADAGPGTFGPYQVLGAIGAGGMGVVYLAYDRDLGRFVAVKAVPGLSNAEGPAAARWERERQAHGRLDHPNLVRAYCTVGEGDARLLVMEYVDGLSLQDLVGAAGPLPAPAACEAVRQAALGLGFAHEVGVIHRDIKPSNLMADRRGTVKVLDLGIALLQGAGETAPRLTADHHAPGTLDFMAPEQLLSPRSVDGRADVFALAATLYYLLTGRPPRGDQPSVLHAARAIDADEAPPTDGVPDELAKVILAALSRDPEDRPADPDAFAGRLLPFAAGGAAGLRKLVETFGPAPPVPPPRPLTAEPGPTPAEKSAERRGLLTHLSLGAIVLGGLGGLLMVAQERGRAMHIDPPTWIRSWLEVVYLFFEVACLMGGLALALAKRRILHKFVLVLCLTGVTGLAGFVALRRDPQLFGRATTWARGTVLPAESESESAPGRPPEAGRLRAVVALMEDRLGRLATPSEGRRKRFLLAGPAFASGRPAVDTILPRPEVVDEASGVYLIDLDALGLKAADWDRLLAGYPYGVRNEAWDGTLRQQTGREPLPYVRADWLLAGPLARGGTDLKVDPTGAAFARSVRAYRTDLGWPEVAAELWLDPAADPAGLKERFEAPELSALPGVAGLLAEGRISRDDWSRVYQEVFRALGFGTPVSKILGD